MAPDRIPRLRARIPFYFFLPGRCDPGQRSTMKRIRCGDDSIATFSVPEFSRQLEQTFVRLGAAIAKKYSARPDMIDNPFRKLPLRLSIIEVRNVDQFFGLLGQRFCDLGMRVA